MILSTTASFYLVCAGFLAGAAEHDLFTGADYFLNYSFEDNDDQDFDGQPDDWIRRKGPAFPSYVETGIDRTRGCSGKQSLRFKVNGGQAAIYSDPKRIDSVHSYVFQGSIRTQLLKHDAALLSISFLNHKRQRVQRFLSRPVTGTHQDWALVRIGPVAPQKDVTFVVIGCHLLHGKKMDIRGAVWFDDLRLGRLPQLSLVSNFHTHFKKPNAPIEIISEVSGLDPGHRYQLHLRMIDSSGEFVQKKTFALEAETSPPSWNLPSQGHGFYRVESTLERGNKVILSKQTAFAVMDLVGDRRSHGEFGWSIARVSSQMSLFDLADVATEGGINWLKYPLWKSVYSHNHELPSEISRLFDVLIHRRITPVGLLNEPPLEMRNKFAREWSGISEIFSMPPSFWAPSMEKVIARYSSSVRYWQLGSESDLSFVRMNRLPQTLATIKREFDRIGRDTRIGLHWDWDAEIPSRRRMPQSFLSISGKDADDPGRPLSGEQLVQKLKQSAHSGIPRWVVLKPLAKSKYTPDERGADLVKRMVAAKIGGAEAIFADDVFDEQHGLLNRNGSPTMLFLPWRTTALALQEAKYLGSFNMPGGSQNFVFARENEVVLIVWGDEESQEEIYLGNDTVEMDVWGRKRPLPFNKETHRQIVQIGPMPKIIRGCSKPIALWRMAIQFSQGRLRSETGVQKESVSGINTFSQSVNGTVTLHVPREWDVEPTRWTLPLAAGEKFTLPMLLTLPPNASLGTESLSIDFDIIAGRPYKFRVYRPYQVGIGDVGIRVFDRKLADGSLEVEQIITNDTTPVEILSFRCSLFIPGHRRQKRFVIRLGKGENKQLYVIPNAEALQGQELWLRAEQIDGRRVLNFRWNVGENDEEGASSKSKPMPPRTPLRN